MRLYRKKGIKRKLVRRAKLPPHTNLQKYIGDTHTCRNEVSAALKAGTPIVYIDEVIFSKQTYTKQDYGARHKIIEVDEAKVYCSYVAACAAVSTDGGLDLLCTYDSALNADNFAQFLKDLHAVRGKKRFAAFLDNASFHRAHVVKDMAKELGVQIIWNVPYSPEYNPIEGAFSIVKNHFKRERLNAMLNDRIFSFQKGIQAAFKELTIPKIASMVARSHKLLKVVSPAGQDALPGPVAKK